MLHNLLVFLSGGLLQLPWWGVVLTVLVLTHITIISVTVFLHRSQAHRALDLHPILSHFFRFWLWMTTGMTTKAWVSIHRKHHARCETEDDPHSPQVLGLPTVLFFGAELYRDASKKPEILERYGHGTPDDWVERVFYTGRTTLGIILMLIIDLLCFGVVGLAVWAVQMIWIPFFAAGVINGIGHFWGYRNFECTDAATNISPWGILIGGEELHNNHHTYGSAAKLSVKPWEFDIGWMYINIFRAFGLAKVRKVPPKMITRSGDIGVDAETLKAVLTNRFEVLADYTKDVVAPVFDRAVRDGGDVKRSAKKLLSKEASIMTQKNEKQLAEVLASNSLLNTIYQFRLNLQTIWSRTTASQKELIEAVSQWCVEAEATGIDALKNFSKKLQTYAV